MGTARIDHDLGRGLTLQNITRYGETERNSAITAPRPPNRQLQRRDMRNEVFINQTNLAAAATTGDIRHNVCDGRGSGAGGDGDGELVADRPTSRKRTLRFPNPSERPST